MIRSIFPRGADLDKLLEIPYELQIVLVAGYIAYKITTIGKSRFHRTEDFLLQVLSFGVVARSLAATVLWLRPETVDLSSGDAISIAVLAVLSCAFAAVTGMIWRSFGERLARKVMNKTGVYQDDHESSVWQSIIHHPAKWTVLQIHLSDGRVLESNFGKLRPFPKPTILLNEDGVGFYITGIYSAENLYSAVDHLGNEDDMIFTYIPRSEIKQMDVAWQT
jgi:hypothetical protein